MSDWKRITAERLKEIRRLRHVAKFGATRCAILTKYVRGEKR